MAARDNMPVPQLLLIFILSVVSSKILMPPYFNLAHISEVAATATCGVRSNGSFMQELYCGLIGNSTFNEENRQVCDICNPIVPDKNHPAENAIDGTEKWWQSPPLSRGNTYNRVNFTINFGQEFYVAYIFIKMANSPRPEVWELERSVDFGRTWNPWQYFAGTNSDCYKFFNLTADQSIERDDEVICSTRFSQIVPLENGEIVVSLENGRPSALGFNDIGALQNWTKATNIRLKLLRTKTLLGHLLDVARQDSNVTRRYFYSIKDISIGGRCICNGHADSCNRSPNDPSLLVCDCQHNTCGTQCEQCCPGYMQKKWQPSWKDSTFICERDSTTVGIVHVDTINDTRTHIAVSEEADATTSKVTKVSETEIPNVEEDENDFRLQFILSLIFAVLLFVIMIALIGRIWLKLKSKKKPSVYSALHVDRETNQYSIIRRDTSNDDDASSYISIRMSPRTHASNEGNTASYISVSHISHDQRMEVLNEGDSASFINISHMPPPTSVEIDVDDLHSYITVLPDTEPKQPIQERKNEANNTDTAC